MHELVTRICFCTLVTLTACGPSAGGGGDDDIVTEDPCSGTEARCVGQGFQVCQNDFFVQIETCSGGNVCDPGLGCVECRPSSPFTCVGDDVHACNSDGTVGEYVETCEFEQCSNGNCGGDDCAAGADLIYLVDDTFNFYSFDPRLLPGDPYKRIGTLSCPAAPSLVGWDPMRGPSTPFSMSVDRNATAWVLYTSGEIFHVSTQDASCTATGFQVNQQGFELFGMGFVSDSPGSSAETLWISGGSASIMGSGDLGKIDPGTMTVSRVASLPAAEFSPEMTGTSNAELFGYYPGQTSFVAKVNKSTAQNDQTWNLPSLTDQVRAWAFAHWGGQFYIFITTADALIPTNTESNVLLLDPGTGGNSQPLSATGKIVVGAGVSTCAPVVVN